MAFWISVQVAGIVCMMPRAPTGETAVGSSPLSCTPCAFSQSQSGPPGIQRPAACRNSESYRGENESDQQGGADIPLAVIISGSARIAEDERQRAAVLFEVRPAAGEDVEEAQSPPPSKNGRDSKGEIRGQRSQLGQKDRKHAGKPFTVWGCSC